MASTRSQLFLAGALAAGVLAASEPALGQPAARTGYVIVGEALSSARANETIQFAARMFTIHLLDDACRKLGTRTVQRLTTQPSRLALRVGQPFSPSSLTVVARNANGDVIPRVPLAIEVDSPVGLFAPTRDATGAGPRVPAAAGTATFRARTLCPGATADVLIDAAVRELTPNRR